MTQRKFGHVEIPFKRIHIELTNACEFNCRFCPKTEMKRDYGFLDPDLGKKIISEIAEHRLAEKITFHVMGEPTLYPEFFSLLDHSAARNVKVGLTTNGKSLGGPVGEKLLDFPLHQIDVSFQTPDEASFELREAGELEFGEYLDGILGFFTAHRARWPDTIFKFRFLNTLFPIKSLEAKKGPIRVMSSSKELRETFSKWVREIYGRLGVSQEKADVAVKNIGKLVSYKWNVVEILPNLFFETYVLEDWGHAFYDGPVHDAWAGYCFGMRDHFAIMHNGDVILCCVDFDGKTAVGNLNGATLAEILSSDKLGKIMEGFRKFRLVHPYCKRCLGSKSRLSWLAKPIAGVIGLGPLKPFFYNKTKIYE